MPTRNIFIIVASLIVCGVCYIEFHKNRYVDTLAKAMNIIENQALKKLTRRELFRAAMNGMVAEIDEHSAFYDGKEVSDFRETLEQEFGGIGVEVEDHPDTGLTIRDVFPGTPAAEAGMLPGDVITAVNQNSTEKITPNQAVKQIKGPVGYPVDLEYRHRGTSEKLSATLIRERIEVPSVEGDFRNSERKWVFYLQDHPDIGYLRMPTTFGEKSEAEMQAALESLPSNVKGVVLDLRGNPGGLLETAIKVSDMFISSDRLIVETRRRDREIENQYFSTDRIALDESIPMVVLINGRSASASEIVAACLQDHDRAIVCGSRTWGKGTVQNVIPMENQKSVLKITTASYWRPSGKNIHRAEDAQPEDEWGVLPSPGYEVVVSTDEEIEVRRYRNLRERKNIGLDVPKDFKVIEDRQLAKAIKYLKSK